MLLKLILVKTKRMIMMIRSDNIILDPKEKGDKYIILNGNKYQINHHFNRHVNEKILVQKSIIMIIMSKTAIYQT